ncbi:MAG: response regulator transcription factor [Akkermansiaceae bacterium]|nr:response regulator transcription factor [Akkermansiaceae bacterium]
MSTTIWVLEDHDNFAKQIMRLINAEDDMECPHHFRSADEMYEKVKFTKDHPDLLLLDLGLPKKGGLEVLTDLKTLMPNTKVLILSSFDEREKVYRAICNGAAGYLLKTSDPDELMDGIRDILQGESALSSPIAKMILEGFSRHGPVEQTEPLTTREQDVLRFLVQGLIKKEIADELDISQHTVDMHVRSIYRKLHVHSQTEAVSKALRQGIV